MAHSKPWWIFKADGEIITRFDGSARIYPTKAAAKKSKRDYAIDPKETVTIERVWLEWELEADNG